MRDFLVQIREFTGEDDTDLYLEEREVRSNFNCSRFLQKALLKLLSKLVSDCPEGRARGETKSADVRARHP